MKRKIVVIVVILAVLGGGGWFGYKRFFGAPAGTGVTAVGPEGAPVVQVETVSRRMLVQEVFAPGTVEAGNLQEYKAALASPRVTLLVEVGQQVEAGQLLAELDATDLLEDVKAKERDLLQAERRLEELRRSLNSAPLELDRAVQEARRQLIEAQNRLAKLRGESASGGESSEVKALREQINQLRNQAAAAQQAVNEARAALSAAEAAYMAKPGDADAERTYRTAEEAYRRAVAKNDETARDTASKLAEAQEELDALLSGGSTDELDHETAVRLAEIQVKLAEAAVKEAEEAFQRGPDLGQIQLAEAEVEAARATLEKLRGNLESTRITATAPGTVLSLGVRDGDPVQQGAVIARVGDMERMSLVGQVEAVDLDSLERGQTIMVTSALLPLASFEGVVTGVGQQTSQSSDPYMGMYYGESVTFEGRGEVDNPEGRLKSGMSVEMRIETSRREDVIVVPLLAVREEAGQAFVLVVNDFRVELRPIRTGLVTNREVEVLSGLEEGEMIVTSPFGLIETLQEGDAVRIESWPGMEPAFGPGMGGSRGRAVPAQAVTVPAGSLTGGTVR